MRKIATLLILACLMIPIFLEAQEKNPKTVNYFLHWSINEDQARELAKWDLLVLDMELQENSPDELRLIRRLNPDVKIIAYITSQNLFDVSFAPDNSSLRNKLRQEISDSWWLRDAGGNRLSDWPSAYVLNITDYCQKNNNGERFNDFLPRFVAENILSSGFWDGIFYDNTWNGASWFNGGNISLLNNGRKNSATELDSAWRAGVIKLFSRTKELYPSAIIIANGSFIPEYKKYLNGWMLEDFPTPWQNGGSWQGVMQTYFKLPDANQSYNIINGASGNQNDYADFRYGLASALMGNAYYSFDYGPQDHGRMWWYDEFDVNLGAKQNGSYNLLDKNNKTIKPGLWRTDFSGGIALVNSTDKVQTYVFNKEEFEKIRGLQDPAVNNGQKVNWVRINPRDGLILLKTNTLIKNNSFFNGYFFRVFDLKGSQTRNGFFAYLDGYAGSQSLLVADFLGRGETQIASASRGVLTISSNGKTDLSFKPYGEYKGSFNMSLGDVDGNGISEIVTGAGFGGGPHVRIFDLKGNVKGSFMAYDSKFRGGVNVAVGDLDGDGISEIVTGAGKGGGPHVRIFDLRGNIKGSFMAYESSYRGGITVAVDDLDANGVAEILTGISDF